ncbi:N-Dimethylarginine dimethylaminohydrolase [Nocardioides scoriae]|uniref:N-Dimethylarginine dimethylaminohydrolase n=1 Tax=Nocardioides scoriae TaxID=642780 RepID=A0A1H1WCY4_9ACTN|nr:arginine deiminase-related protein [Nocardioides scoriae]SDS94571.1 N-Dimethylarginine dimethylaminohydrolase [Nocardioides scoriae]
MSTRPAPLAWGRRYLAVSPDHFRVDYAINPFMHLDDQPDPVRTREQWDAMLAAIEAAGATVEVLPQLAEAPDMVYAMNLGLALERPTGEAHVVLSHMRYAERRMETPVAERWFADHGASVQRTGRDGVGAHLEAGDAFAFGGELVVGYGPRTEELALKHLATELGVSVRGFRIVHPGMYHMDLGFCPLDETRAMVCPAAYDDASAAALLDLVPEPLVLSEEEAMTFCANSVVVGRTVVMPACPDRVRARLEEWGFEVVVVEVGEFLKGGGAIRCLTNPLDVRLGRDLDLVPGGRVTLA